MENDMADNPKTTGYVVTKATIKDSYGNKVKQGETAQLTATAAKDMVKRGLVKDKTTKRQSADD